MGWPRWRVAGIEWNPSEAGVLAAAVEILWLEVQGLESAQIFRAEAGEFVEELIERFALALFDMAEAIEWGEGLGFSELQDGFCARHPVGALAVDQVGDYVGDGPGVFAFVLVAPCFG